MEPNWQLIERHLRQVMELPHEERGEYLRETYVGQDELRQTIEAYLALEVQVENFLEVSPVPAALAPLQAMRRTDLPAGHIIGPYRILRVLGHGGMSTVYLAESVDSQDHGDATVALKVILPGANSVEIVRRFHEEQRILAQLDHPNIARLLDAGTTEQDFPFFVMEAIEGRAIDAYCDVHQLTVSERLGLFRQVCSAVHYAHQNLVIHLDIKPSNILVTEEGIPKLLDFGIAKLLNPQVPGELPDPTLTNLRAMTPNYASPEQIRGQAITTASDTYSLGVLLYKLTTGRLPYRFPNSLPQDIDRITRASPPVEPSQIVVDKESAANFRKIAEDRGVSPEKLGRQLRGDIDNIILMALRWEPQRRYGSVEKFAEDLKRLRAGLPVSARPDTALYRARKFLGRHKLGVTAIAAMMLLVTTFGVLTAVHSARLERERQQTDEVAEFLISLYETSGAVTSAADSITAREVLEQGARRVLGNKDLQPPVRATVLHSIGRGFNNLRLFDRALPLFEEALKVREQLLGEGHPQTVSTLHHLGVAQWGAGNFEASAEAFERALAYGQRQDLDSLGVAEVLSGQASLKRDQGDFKGAEEAGRRAYDIRRRELGPDHPETAHSKVLLAFLQFDLEAYAESESLYRGAIETLRGRNSDPELAKAISGLGLLLMFRGDATAAEPLARESIDLHREIFGEDHPAFADSVSILAYVKQELGDLEAAEKWQRHSLTVLRKHYGEDHPSIARSAYNLALILAEGGAFDEAEGLFRQALAVARQRMGEGHVRYANGLVDLAWVRQAKGDEEEAEALYRQAVAILEAADIEDENIFMALAKMGLGGLLSDLGQLAESEEALLFALEELVGTLGEDHWRVAQVKNELGICRVRQGRIAEATPWVIESHRLLAERRGEASEITRRAHRHVLELQSSPRFSER